MTVSTTTNKVSYSGTGSQTVFAYTFKIFADGDLDVYIRDTNGTETLQTITTNYTVSGAGSDSGGNVTFVTAPGSTDTVVIQRKLGLTQGTDYVANDPFPAESHEDALDRLTFITQQIQEEVDRSIKASVTNTISTTEFAVSAADRANKFFAFDSAGDLVVSQEIGTFRGNWAGSTSYAQRDIVKDTSTNNIFIVNTAHTSSGAQPLTSNANSAKYDLLVDAATATAQATTATAQAAASAASAAASATSATSSAASASTSTTQASNSSTSASNASTSETNAATSATASAASAAAAAATFDLFDDAYLGAKSSNPSVDNDVNALQDGALFFDTVNSVMKVFDLSSTTWFQLTPTVSNQTNINTVAGISSDVTAVAGDAADIGTLATDINGSNNIGTVSGAITNVNLVGGSIANVNTVATNIADVNNFADTYFISATAPANPTQGDLWFDTDPASLVMKVYDGSGFVNAGSSVNGTSNRTTHTATAGQTSFAATYDAGFVDVYLNGVKLINGTDFTATSGSSVVLATGAALNDTVDIVGYGTFELQNTSLDDLSDVSSASASTGQFLKWNGTNWVGDTVTIPSTDLVNDTTPQLGGALDAQSNNITSVGQLAIGTATPAKPLTVEGGSDYNMALRSASNRSGLAIHAPGTGTLSSPLASVTVLGSDNSFRLGTQTYYNLIMNQSGHVTTPNQPAFRVNANVSQTLGTGWQTVGYGTSLTQRGSAYNASTFIFTAPTAGWYQFSASWTATNNADTDGTFALSINGSHSNLINSVSMPNTGINYEGHSVAGCAYLAVGDNVKVVRYSSVTTTTRTSVYYGGWFTGFFIG